MNENLAAHARECRWAHHQQITPDTHGCEVCAAYIGARDDRALAPVERMRVDEGRGTARGQGRAVMFGRVEHLAELFTDITPRTWGEKSATVKEYTDGAYRPSDRRYPCHLTDYATIELKSGYPKHHGARVMPSADVIRVIDHWMIHPTADTISFGIIEWDNGDALVTARNSQIIGGVWLAFLAPSAVEELRAALNPAPAEA